MKRRIIRFLAIILVFSLCFGSFSTVASAETTSSAYILMTGASITPGSSAGKISVNYTITGMGMMDTIGVLCIEVYRVNGMLFSTIYGSTSNGLLVNSSHVHAGSYEVSCIPGHSFYCEVTLIAAKNGGGDTRTLKTKTIIAPTSP